MATCLRRDSLTHSLTHTTIKPPTAGVQLVGHTSIIESLTCRYTSKHDAHMHARTHKQTRSHTLGAWVGPGLTGETFGKSSKNVYYNIMDWYILEYTMGYTIFCLYRAYMFKMCESLWCIDTLNMPVLIVGIRIS